MINATNNNNNIGLEFYRRFVESGRQHESGSNAAGATRRQRIIDGSEEADERDPEIFRNNM